MTVNASVLSIAGGVLTSGAGGIYTNTAGSINIAGGAGTLPAACGSAAIRVAG